MSKPRGGKAKPKKSRGGRPRPPTTAAVAITIVGGEGEARPTYSAVLREAKEKICLKTLEISGSRVKPALNGGLLVEIPGRGRKAKAESLSTKLSDLFREKEGVRITVPQKCAEVRVRNIEPAITPEDVKLALAKLGGVKAEEVQVGKINRTPAGRGSAWARCPVVAAQKAVQARRLRLGWGFAAVEPLKPRPAICYRCLEPGHVRARCKAEVDRSSACFRCGAEGHQARQCAAEPRCLTCEVLGLSAAHRFGGRGCNPKAPRRGRKSGGETREKAGPPADRTAKKPKPSIAGPQPKAREDRSPPVTRRKSARMKGGAGATPMEVDK